MLVRRFGRPGLIGLAARTAVVAGTATAVSGGMRRAAYNRQRQDEAVQQAAAAQQEQQIRDEVAAAQPAAPAPASSPLLDQVNQLAQLHASGVLSDEEFTAAKAKLLS